MLKVFKGSEKKEKVTMFDLVEDGHDCLLLRVVDESGECVEQGNILDIKKRNGKIVISRRTCVNENLGFDLTRDDEKVVIED